MRNILTLLLILFCLDANATVQVPNYFSHSPVAVCQPSDSNSNCGGGSSSIAIGTTSPMTGAGTGSSFTLGVDQSKLTLSSIGGAVTDAQVPNNITITNLSGTNTGDQTISDATISTTDITTNDVSTSKHGFAPKAPNDSTKFLDGTGAYSVPPSGAGGWVDGGTNVYESTTTDRVGIGTTTANALTALEIVKQSSLAPLMISSAPTGGGNYLIINSAGNVGIGTRGPTSLLQVGGTANATTLQQGGVGVVTTARALTMTGTTNQITLSTGSQDLSADRTWTFSLPSQATPWIDGGTNIYQSTTTDTVGIGTTGASGSLEIVKQGSVVPLMISSVATGDGDYFKIDSAGNIGIGTISPRSAFVVIGGNVGIGTTSPQATIEISGPATQSTIAGGLNISSGNFGIGSATPGALVDVPGKLRILSGGNLIFGGTAPTVATNDCGSTAQGTVTTKSTNNSGSITAGTLNVTSCAITFNTAIPFVNAPFCMCQDDTNILGCKVSSTTTKMTVTTTTSMSGDVIAYHCFGGE